MRFKVAFLLGILTLVAGFTSMLAEPGVSTAAPGNGAVTNSEQVDIYDCYDSFTATYCYIAKGEYHSTCNPTGSCNYQLNYQKECYSVTNNITEQLLYESCSQDTHYQFHTKSGGDPQVDSDRFIASGVDIVQGETYCFTSRYHIANGQLQYAGTTPC